MPDSDPNARLILHIKGTENQTAELPKEIVRAGIAQGQISRSQLIWSAAHNAWKQVRELPHLLPSQQIAPPPAPRVGTAPLPKAAEGEPVQTGSVPRVAFKITARGGPPGFKATVAKPTVKAAVANPTVKAAAARPAVKAARPKDMVVKEEAGFGYLKWFCIGLAILILAVVGVNYLMVDQPLSSDMSKTAYANVPVYAHLGAFVQPGALVIHVPPTQALNSANLADFLQVLAHNTPEAPAGGGPFDVISLTSSWTGHYSFTGYAWKEFGDMAGQDDEHKQAFLLDKLMDTSGQALLSPNGSLDPSTQQHERDRVWTEFVTYFTSPADGGKASP